MKNFFAVLRQGYEASDLTINYFNENRKRLQENTMLGL